MKNYRLKKEAVKFFIEKHATAIYSEDTWKDLGVDLPALDEVKDAFITYGHAHKLESGTKTATLGGWSKETGTHFHFTINFPSVKFEENDRFMKGKSTRALMDRIQSAVDNFYVQFSAGETDEK